MKTLLTSLFMTISIMSFGQKSETKLIFFDGLYESKCIIEEDDDEGSQSYLRFYPDGKVISVGTDCEGTIDELIDWFHIDAAQVSAGNYEIIGKKIHFSTSSKIGIVNYRGRILSDKTIKLKWKSHINHEKGHDDYKFVKLEGLK